MKDKALATVRGVLFDWDLTLARTIGDVSRNARLAALFQKNGFPCTLESVEEAVLVHQREVDRGPQSATDFPPQTQANTIKYYLQILAFLGYTNVTQEQATELYHAYARLPTILYDDAIPTLRRLKKQGLQIGIVSNHTPHVRDSMESLIGSFVNPEHIIISEEIGLHKPSPAIFLKALERIQLPSSQCVFVGDNLFVDAIGAVQQGGLRRGFWLDRDLSGKPPALPEQIVRITSLSQVLDFLSI